MKQSLQKRAGALRSFAAHIKEMFMPGRDAAARFSSLKGAVRSGGELITEKKHVVTVGGGTGTFVVLSALKDVSGVSLSAIVSVADDGGSTGRLRDAYGIIPPGDARQALVALAKDGSLLRSLFTHRFEKGDIAGHNFGNLFLTALSAELGSDAAAIRAASDILRVKGKVVPVSERPAVLTAELRSGEVLVGQHTINARPSGGSPIQRLGLETPVETSKEAMQAIATADMVVLGPGDLYTSTLANFAVPGLSAAVGKSKAKLIYFVNLFTNASETDGYTAKDYVAEITRYTGRKPDVIFVHAGALPNEVVEYYAKKDGHPVLDDLGDDPRVIRGDFADPVTLKKTVVDVIDRSIIRHDPEKVRVAITKLL
ncbi:MAG: YvcK family protein [Patescibacteria group bacterium]|nr:YvcK family protein [Patescibacteria group bacterium]